MRLAESFVASTLALLVCAATAAGQTVPPAAAVQPAKPMVTVADFATDRTGWMPPPGFGTTLAEVLTDRLIAAGTYRVMDRSWLTASLDDPNRPSLAALIDRAAAAHVDYLVLGSVTRFSIEKRSSNTGGIVPLPLVGGLIHKEQTEYVVGLTIRVVDVGTGEVVATSTAEQGATDRSTSGGGIVVVAHVPIAGGKGSSATGFQDRLVNVAFQQAVTEAAEKLVAASLISHPPHPKDSPR